MNTYNTRQHKILINYLKENADSPITSDKIIRDICGKYEIGKSTVYRQIAALKKDGMLQRVQSTDGKSAVYQYMDISGHCGNHFHLKCEKCGVLIHLECGIFPKFQTHIMKSHGFEIDSKKSIIYGLCSKCREGAEK